MALEDYIREQNAKKEKKENTGAQSRMAQTKQSSRDTAEADHWHDGI